MRPPPAPRAPAPLTAAVDTAEFARVLGAGLARLVAAEPALTRYDTLVGDGDCGTGLKRGAEALQAALAAGGLSPDPATAVARLAAIVEETMDGTSGALCSIFLNALCRALGAAAAGRADTAAWAAAAADALDGLRRYTPARAGDRTLMDALEPFLAELQRRKDVVSAARCAREGAESTRGMLPRLGRTVYIEQVGDIPDPGAVGIAELVEGLAGV